MPEINRFNKATLRKYMQVPKDRWSPIPSPDDIHMGMVIRNPDEPDNPVFYLYVMTETPVKGHHLVKSLDGTRESKVMPKALVKRYHYYTGPSTPAGLPTETEPKKAPIPPPPQKTDKKSGDADTAARLKDLKEHMERRKTAQQLIDEAKPAIEERKRRERLLAESAEKRRVAEKRKMLDALETLDKDRVDEEKKLLQAACLALAYAFGKDAPDACDTTYAEIINHMATDVVLGKITHTDAVAAVVARIRADADKKAIETATTDDTKRQNKTSTVIDARLTQVEKDIKSLDKQISRMTTHMENVLKRWEAISPFIPTNTIQYFESSKHKRSTKKGGTIGITSYQTGNIEKIETDKSLDDIGDSTRVLFVKNGICIHFKQSVAKDLHISIASHMGYDPKSVWGYDFDTDECLFDKSDEKGYDYVRCFDLTRSDTNEPYKAAGGRISDPARLVKRIRSKFKDNVLVVVTEGADLA